MTTCATHQERISALFDDELDAMTRGELNEHLDSCAPCRAVLADLQRTRLALAGEFATVLAAAPPPPRFTTARRKWPGWLGLAATLAAAVLVLVWISEPDRLEASPLTLLERAALEHRAARDVELYATVESGLIDVITKLSGKQPEGGDSAPPYFRVLVKKPDRVLLHAVPNLRSRQRADDGELMGYDGEQAWQYDPESQVVRTDRRMRFSFKSSKSTSTSLALDDDPDTGPAHDLLRYLSWDFVKTLAEEAGEHDIIDITGPAATRAGRRVFRLAERAPENGESQWFWDQAEITIDPEQNLIEQMVFDVKLVGVSLIHIKLELSRVNGGFVDRDFDFRSYVPPGTPVIAADDDR